MYILINAETYDMNLKKIAFMLSLMEEGDTASWKQQLIEETFDQAILAGTNPDFGTLRSFISSLKDAFEPYDSKGDALEEMKVLRIGDMPIDEHITKYKMLVTKAKLKDDVTTSTDSVFTAVIGYSQYLIMPKHLSKELAEPMNINWKTSSQVSTGLRMDKCQSSSIVINKLKTS